MKKINKYTVTTTAVNSLVHVFLILVSATCIFPLLWMLGSSLKTQSTVFSDMSLFPSTMHWKNYLLAWTEGGFGVYFLNSVFYTVTVVFGIIMVSSWAAYAFSRMNFPGKNIFFFMFLGAMMIPLPGAFVPLYVLVNNARSFLLNGLAAATPALLKILPDAFVYGSVRFIEEQLFPRSAYILCMVNVGLSLSIYMLKTFFDKMPKELEDAARIDGCSRMGIWRHVALPLAKPAIAVITIYNALNVWNEYILANLILPSKSLMPLQRGLMVFQGEHVTQYPLLMAGMTITVLPILIIYLAMQRFIIKGITAGAVVG
jgi:multiple sugar transport system permease protein/raffinose/stachyose/melibiose transport system permease protein